MNIKKRLPLTIALLVATPLVILNIVLYLISSHAIMGDAQSYLDMLARIEAKQVGTVLSMEAATVRHGSKNEIMRQRLHSNNPQVARDFQHFLFEFRRDSDPDRVYLLLNVHGTVIASDSGQFIGFDLSTYKFFKPMTTTETKISNVFRLMDNLPPVIAFGADVSGSDGKADGFFVQLVPVSRLTYLTRTISLGHTGYGYLLDSNGVIISHPDQQRLGTMTENAFMLRQIRLDAENSIRRLADSWEFQTYEYRGEWKYMGFRRVPETGWYLVVNQTVTEIQAPVGYILSFSLGTLLVMGVGSIILAIRFSRFITTPINIIRHTVEEIAEGNLATRCEYEADNELGTLARHINHMIAQLSDSRVIIQERDTALINSEIRYRLAADGSNDAVYEWQPSQGLAYVSPKYEELVGLPNHDLGAVQQDFLHALFPEDLVVLKQAVQAHLNDSHPYFRVEVRIRDQNDEVRWLLIRGKAHWDEAGQAQRIAGSITNITDRRIKEERIRSLAFSDQLTGLPNRLSFLEDAPAIFAEFSRNFLQSGVAMLDVDDFRKINDALGHGFGDQILIQIARQLSAISRGGRVYRFGGDEFIIILPGMEDMSSLDAYTLELLDCLQSGIQISGKSFFLTMTVGVCLFPQDSQEAQEILRKADTAMYAAKQKGKRTLAFYNPDMYEGLSQRIHLESILRQAIRDERLVLYYQPLVAMSDLRLIGFEALMRIPDPQGGFISPDKFIPIAEESGLIHQMGYWIFEEVCLQIQRWKSQDYLFDYISLNVSALQFHDPHFSERLYGIVREHRVDPAHIQIEITETALMESRDSVTDALDQIRSWGFKIALDDFGTGYSSLGYLKTIPITSLKMDKTFIHDIVSNSKQEAIADGIIQMAKNMGLAVIAEGIETQEQFHLLVSKGCTIAQGYLFSPPLPAEQVESIFRTGFPELPS